MVGVSKTQLECSIPPECPHSKMKPVLSVGIRSNIRVTLDFQCEWIGGSQGGVEEISGGKAAVSGESLGEGHVGMVGIAGAISLLHLIIILDLVFV